MIAYYEDELMRMSEDTARYLLDHPEDFWRWYSEREAKDDAVHP